LFQSLLNNFSYFVKKTVSPSTIEKYNGAIEDPQLKLYNTTKEQYLTHDQKDNLYLGTPLSKTYCLPRGFKTPAWSPELEIPINHTNIYCGIQGDSFQGIELVEKKFFKTASKFLSYCDAFISAVYPETEELEEAMEDLFDRTGAHFQEKRTKYAKFKESFGVHFYDGYIMEGKTTYTKKVKENEHNNLLIEEPTHLWRLKTKTGKTMIEDYPAAMNVFWFYNLLQLGYITCDLKEKIDGVMIGRSMFAAPQFTFLNRQLFNMKGKSIYSNVEWYTFITFFLHIIGIYRFQLHYLDLSESEDFEEFTAELFEKPQFQYRKFEAKFQVNDKEKVIRSLTRKQKYKVSKNYYSYLTSIIPTWSTSSTPSTDSANCGTSLTSSLI
jgi:hypothetical protein